MSKKQMLGVLVVLTVTVLAVAGTATVRAQPVLQAGLQLTSLRPGGPITFRISERFYDTTGAVPPPMTTFYARLPAGLTLRHEFLNARYYCNGPALRDALDARQTGAPFTQRVANLKPFIRSLARSRSKADLAALANARVCDRARVAVGTAQIDARTLTPVLSELIPARFSGFLSRGTVPGAIAGVAVLGAADMRGSLVRRFPVIAGLHAALMVNFLKDPTPDGRYGYKVLLPTGPINGLRVSIAEVRGTVSGITIPKETCVRRGRSGRCRARRRTDLSWLMLAKCPPAGLSAQLFAAFAPPTPSITTTLLVPCPQFTP
ncbi:MAG: hypothetical protein JSS99_16330 [Actinobacteria bacterium]|nr:hypothetical protein [Actinomycetota bacterium]